MININKTLNIKIQTLIKSNKLNYIYVISINMKMSHYKCLKILFIDSGDNWLETVV